MIVSPDLLVASAAWSGMTAQEKTQYGVVQKLTGFGLDASRAEAS
jgi:hypothetical protein